MAENVNGCCKNELIGQKRWQNVAAIEIATFQWVSGWNNTRLHASLDYKPPTEVEASFWAHTEPSKTITHKTNTQEQNPTHFNLRWENRFFKPLDVVGLRCWHPDYDAT